MAQPHSQVPQAPTQLSQPNHMQQMSQTPQMPQVPQMAQRPQSYSPAQQLPPQHSPSPTNNLQSGYSMPPTKRPRNSPTSPPTSQAPYATAQYAANQQAAAPSLAPATSSSYSNLAAPAPAPAPSPAPAPAPAATPAPVQQGQQYSTPYTNGGSVPSPGPVSTPSLTLPETRPAYPTSPAPSAAATPPSSQQYTTATMAPIAPPPPPPTPGAMLPPSKPAERPTKEVEYDVSDSLAGTGIDLRAEEQYLAEFYGGSFAQEARTGAPANAPGSRASFYGAGPANQPGEPVDAASQEAYEAEAAQRAWDEAAHRLAAVRSIEINDPFLIIPNLHHRVEKIAKEHGIGVNLELKNPNPMGKLRAPQEFPQPTVTVSTKPGPDGAMVVTTGSLIPHDAYLVDQIALLSIATKHRLRELIEDAQTVARNRQTTSHMEIPPEWADVAVPLRTGLDSLPDESLGGDVNANPRKRSFDAFAAQAPTSSKGSKHGPRNLMEAVRERARSEREVEEARLRKRQKRQNPESAQAGSSSRAGSAAPGTPGAGPETETATKAPSKKELKKGAAAARLAEQSSTASANQTLGTIMGSFGKKRKEYSWIQKPGSSGASTPRAGDSSSSAAAAGGGGGGGGAAGGAGRGGGGPDRANHLLTSDARYPRLGTWREDKEKGRNIQLRDWVVALEMDGIEVRALQDAYVRLDASLPKDRN